MMANSSKLSGKIKGLMVFLLVALFIIKGAYVPFACAEEASTGSKQEGTETNQESALREAIKNVFRVEVVLRDDKEKAYPIKSGSGFLIGNTARGQEQYIITTKSLITVSDQAIKKIKKKKGVDKKSELKITYQIVVSEDLVVEATVFSRAQDNDFAILTLEKTLADRVGISIGDNALMKEGQAVFSAGYDKSQNQVNLYSSHFEQEETRKKSNYLEFQAALSNADYGGPLLDESGHLQGMNVKVKGNKGMGYALPVNTLKNSLDTLGIAYIKGNSKYGILQKKLEESERLLSNSGDYTDKTVQILEAAMKEAKEVYQSSNATESDYQKQIGELKKAEKQLQPKSAVYRRIILVLAGLAILIGSVILVLWLWDKKKKQRIHYITDQKQEEGIEKQRKKDRKREGTVDMEGTVTISSKIPTAFLVHKSDGMRILITRERFIIGSQKEKTDFCISANRSVSRNHAAVLNENGVFFVQDLNSMNHTFVNGKQLRPHEKVVLRNQDMVQFANEEFLIEIKG